jgi:hypothetical protein
VKNKIKFLFNIFKDASFSEEISVEIEANF